MKIQISTVRLNHSYSHGEFSLSYFLSLIFLDIEFLFIFKSNLKMFQPYFLKKFFYPIPVNPVRHINRLLDIPQLFSPSRGTLSRTSDTQCFQTADTRTGWSWSPTDHLGRNVGHQESLSTPLSKEWGSFSLPETLRKYLLLAHQSFMVTCSPRTRNSCKEMGLSFLSQAWTVRLMGRESSGVSVSLRRSFSPSVIVAVCPR